MDINNSNTTLVKVKLRQKSQNKERFINSNTTLVKVKFIYTTSVCEKTLEFKYNTC